MEEINIQYYNFIKALVELEFNSVNDYFYYITESYINGQKKQAVFLYNDLPSEIKKEFISDCNNIQLIKLLLISCIKPIDDNLVVVIKSSNIIYKIYKNIKNTLK